MKNPDVIIMGYITANKIVLLSGHLGREIYIYFYLSKPKDGIIFYYYIYSCYQYYFKIQLPNLYYYEAPKVGVLVLEKRGWLI
jgi:hypothetical protein